MEDRPLTGQRALVTGANSGIGEGIARALGRAGAWVAVNYLVRPEDAERVAGEIRAGGTQAMAVRADVGQEAEVQAMFRQMLDAWGVIDILVANAGIQRDAPFAEMTLAQWEAVLRVNLTGMFLCAREAVRAMLRQGVRPEVSASAGKILCTSSVHEVIPWAGHVNYAASKGGVKLFMQSLAQEVAAQKVRVNALAPGATRTAMNRPVWSDPVTLAELLRLIPYGRMGEAEDMGRAAVWLASDASEYITGQTIFVDGGMTLYPAFRFGG
jgi:glucose 1-dehydrogenase